MIEVKPNVERLNRFMDVLGVDALVIRSGENFTYLSGIVFPGTLARHLDLVGSDRSVALIWPRDGEPVVVLNDFALGYTASNSLIKTTVYEGYQQQPYESVASSLAALGARRIGVEMNYFTERDSEILRRLLPSASFVDVWGMLNEVRWIKTGSEIRLLKDAADRLDDAYLEVLPTIRSGESERHVHARIMRSCIERGFGFTHGILNSHRNEIMYNGESDFIIEDGDLIRTDYVAYLAGYPGHQSRNVVVGKVSSEVRDTYRKVRSVYGGLLDSIRAGAVVADLFEGVVKDFQKEGLTYGSLLMGHSIGPWFHQQEPVLRRGSKIVLEEDMVLALEPYWGSYHIQDIVRVTDSGCDLLSDKVPTDDLWVV